MKKIVTIGILSACLAGCASTKEYYVDIGVHSPGAFPFGPGTTLADAIEAADGIDEDYTFGLMIANEEGKWIQGFGGARPKV